jgi:hypothetical protein
MGIKSNDYRYNFGLSNLASVGVYRFGDDEGLVSLSFGFAFNKTNNFAQRYTAVGQYQSGNTYMDYFALCGINDGNLPDNLGNDEAYMAYQTYLINYDTTFNEYCPLLADGDQTRTQQYTELDGSLSTYDFSFGGNVSNVFYFGLGVGISAVEFSESNTASEYAREGNGSDFRSFSYNKKYAQSGVGYSFKLGAIAWPFANADILNGLRLGAAVHTRTFLNMNDEYSASINSYFTTRQSEKAWINPNKFFYGIETPTRLMAGIAYVFGGSTLDDWRGILSADYEYADYSAIKLREESDSPALSPSDPNFSTSNANIANFHKSTHNMRLGGELGYKKLAFRLGYAYYDNPYTSKAGKDGTVNIFSGGVGFKVTSILNVSFAYSLATQKDKEYMYYAESQVAGYPNVISEEKAYDISQSNFFISLGWRF